jgi:hypothetical protein
MHRSNNHAEKEGRKRYNFLLVVLGGPMVPSIFDFVDDDDEMDMEDAVWLELLARKLSFDHEPTCKECG